MGVMGVLNELVAGGVQVWMGVCGPAVHLAVDMAWWSLVVVGRVVLVCPHPWAEAQHLLLGLRVSASPMTSLGGGWEGWYHSWSWGLGQVGHTRVLAAVTGAASHHWPHGVWTGDIGSFGGG